MKNPIIRKFLLTASSCLVFAFAVYSGQALMSYLFQEFNSQEIASMQEDLEDARFKDELARAKDTLVDADRQDETPVNFDLPDVQPAKVPLPIEVESSLQADAPEPVSEVSPVSENLPRSPGVLAAEGRDLIENFQLLEPELEILPLPDGDAVNDDDEDDDLDPSPVVNSNQAMMMGNGFGGDGVNGPAGGNPPADSPVDGDIDLEIGDPDAPIVTADLGTGDEPGLSLEVNLPAASTIPDAGNSVSLPVEELAEEVVTATQPVDELVTELEARAARFLEPRGAQTSSAVRRRPTNNAPQPGRIYSGAIAGSVTGVIGGLEAPTAPSSRIQHRPVTINGVPPAAVNPNGITANGATVTLPSTQSPNTSSGAAITIDIPSAGGVIPGAQITVPTPAATGGSGTPIIPSTGLPVPGGVGVSVGGLDVNVNLGL